MRVVIPTHRHEMRCDGECACTWIAPRPPLCREFAPHHVRNQPTPCKFRSEKIFVAEKRRENTESIVFLIFDFVLVIPLFLFHLSDLLVLFACVRINSCPPPWASLLTDSPLRLNKIASQLEGTVSDSLTYSANSCLSCTGWTERSNLHRFIGFELSAPSPNKNWLDGAQSHLRRQKRYQLHQTFLDALSWIPRLRRFLEREADQNSLLIIFHAGDRKSPVMAGNLSEAPRL